MAAIKRAMPSGAELRSVFDYNPETGALLWKFRSDKGKDWNAQHAGKEAGSFRPDGYKQIGLNGRVMYFHRIAWAILHGECRADAVIDHIDGDKSNNRAANLRLASTSQNNANQKIHKNNKSGIKGVSWSAKAARWHVSICFHKKHHFVGEFDRLNDAAAAAYIAREKIHAEFARHQ